MPGRIFISYRRDDVPGDARGLRDGLAAKFGKSSIFMDVDNLLAGQRFDEELAKALQSCDVFLAVIGPRWMEQLKAREGSGERDYVREEIAAALRRRIVVIPVRVGREGQMPPLPRAGDLPEDIRDLVLYQKQDVAHERFGRDIAELVEAVKLARGGGRRTLPWRSIAAAGALVAVLGGGVLAYQMGVPKPWNSAGVRPGESDPSTTSESKRTTDTAAAVTKKAEADTQAKRKAEEADRQRLAMLKAEEDKKRATEEAKRKADADAKGKADAEARRKAEEAERQRLAMLKAEEDRKQAEAEAKRRAEEEAAKRVPRHGETFRDCPECPEMVVVPAGEFTMGSNDGESDEKPVHKVTIRTPFAVGKFEVTFAEWEACVAGGGCTGNRSPSDRDWGKGRRPVINVSWNDAKEYVTWLSRKTGKSYRLLTEAEWEYAARAGTTTPFHTGRTITTSQANFDGNYTYDGSPKGQYRQRTVEVGSFAANQFGLHDMHGNVWEWVEDCWHDSYSGAPNDDSAWTTACADFGGQVLRGGSWKYLPQNVRSADRGWYSTVLRDDNNGFRVARTLDEAPPPKQARLKATPGRCITIERGRPFEVEPGTQFCSSDGRQNAKIVRFREREVFYSTNGGPEIMCRFGELCGFDFTSGPVMWQVQSAPNGVSLTFR